MNAPSILNIVGYATATLVTAAGVAILAGALPMPNVPEQFRHLLGIIMVGYGIFLGVMIWIRMRNARREEKLQKRMDNGE